MATLDGARPTTGESLIGKVSDAEYNPNADLDLSLHDLETLDALNPTIDRHSKALAHPRALHVACHNGLLFTVRLIVDSNPSLINMPDDCKRTPLGLASEKGEVDIIRFLCSRGADANIRDEDQAGLYFAPLHWMAAYGNADCARYLLKKGASMNIRSAAHQTPLHIAALGNQAEFCKTAVTAGDASIDAKDRDGRTPLICAAMRGSLKSLEVLSSLGADVTIAERDEVGGCTALHRAAMVPNLRVATKACEWLLDRIGSGEKAMTIIERRNKNGRTPLGEAAWTGNIALCKLFVRRGCNPELADKYGESALGHMWNCFAHFAIQLEQEWESFQKRADRPNDKEEQKRIRKLDPTKVLPAKKKNAEVVLRNLRGANYNQAMLDKANESPMLKLPKVT